MSERSQGTLWPPRAGGLSSHPAGRDGPRHRNGEGVSTLSARQRERRRGGSHTLTELAHIATRNNNTRRPGGSTSKLEP